MEAFLKLWTDHIEPSTSFVDAEYFEQHSSTLKIISGTFRNILIGDSSDEDSGNEKKPYNTRSSNQKKSIPLVKGEAQMNNSKKLERCYGRPGYVPCFVDERKMKYPKFSLLSNNQQALVVKLMEKYKNCPKFPTPIEKAELQEMEELLNRISDERLAFDNFTKIHCGLNHDRYTFLKPEAKKYIAELWKRKILMMSRYPTCYESQTLLPLVYSAIKDRIVLCMKQVLLQMGTAPVVHVPALRRAVYANMYNAIHKPDNSVLNGDSTSSILMPVSEDQHAEKLAKLHNADVVISLSGLKRIMNNLAPFNKEWNLPVSVKEYTSEEQGRTAKAKVVYIDKALAPLHLTTVERSLWFYRIAVKNVLLRNKYCRNISNEDYTECPLVSIPSQQAKSETDMKSCESDADTKLSVRNNGIVKSTNELNEEYPFNFGTSLYSKSSVSIPSQHAKNETESTYLKRCESDVDAKLSVRSSGIVKSTNQLNEENSINFKTTLYSKKYAKTNVQQPCTKSAKKRKIFESDKESHDSDDDRLIMDCSDTEVFCIKKHKQVGDNKNYDISENEEACLNAKTFFTEKYNQSSNNRDSGDSDEGSENNTVRDCNTSNEFYGQNLMSNAITEDTLHQQASSKLNDSNGNADNGKMISCQDLEQPIDNSVLERDVQKKATFIQDTKETKKCSNLEENKDENMSKSQSSPLPAGKNVIYRLWELKPEESSMDSQKDNFIKGEHPHRSFKILVRTKVDGCEDRRMHGAAEEVHTVRIIPKLEYQCEFGAECLTQDELFAQWAITLFNPETKLIRVRLDPIRSEIMMFENISSQETMQQLGASSKGFLSTLYSILQGLTGLDPGNYLLSHNKKMGSFATLRRAETQGRYNLQSVYSFDPSAAPSYESYPWSPVDRNIITPFQRKYNRVPATFPPASEISKRLKRQNKKKKKKGKNVKNVSKLNRTAKLKKA